MGAGRQAARPAEDRAGRVQSKPVTISDPKPSARIELARERGQWTPPGLIVVDGVLVYKDQPTVSTRGLELDPARVTVCPRRASPGFE